MTPKSPSPKDRRPSRVRARLRAWAGLPGSSRRTLVRNGLWESSSFATHAVVMFFLSPFIVHRLGNSRYGIWEIVISLTGYLSFADLGVRPAAVHFVARHDARGDSQELNRFVNTAFVAFATAGLVVLAVALPLSFLLPRLWNIGSGFQSEAAAALLIVAGELAVSLPLNAFSAVLVGKQRYDLLGRVRLVMLAVKTTAIVVVLSNDWGLVALAAVVATMNLVQMLGFTVMAFRLEPKLRFAPRMATRDALGRLLRFGGWATLVTIALQVTWATDALVIGSAISGAAVAIFAVGFKLAFYARELLRVASRVVEPATGALQALGDRDGIRRLLTKSVRIMLLMAGPILVYLLTTGKPFLHRWMGAEWMAAGDAWKSAVVLGVMSLAVLPTVASAPLAAAHYGMNRVRPLAILQMLEAALNLVLSVILVRRYGIVGVAIGTTIPAFLVHGVLLPLELCRHYGLRWWTFMASTWGGPLLAGALTYLGMRAVVNPEADYGWPTLFLLAGLSVIMYGAAALLVRAFAPALLGQERPTCLRPAVEADA